MFGRHQCHPLLIILGSLGAAFGAVVNFWLGSNRGWIWVFCRFWGDVFECICVGYPAAKLLSSISALDQKA